MEIFKEHKDQGWKPSQKREMVIKAVLKELLYVSAGNNAEQNCCSRLDFKFAGTVA